MQNIEWVNLSSPADSLEDLKIKLLKNRKMEDFENNITVSDLIKSPEKIKFKKEQVIKASNLIKKAFDKSLGIIIHGDYDVDGITSTGLLVEMLINIGFGNSNIIAFIPNRFYHGYGFSKNSYKFIKSNYPANKYPLIILTDCGITSFKIIDKAKKDGYKIILIDHHQKKEKLPNADVIFWNDSLTASVLTYFFSKYIEIKLKGKTNIYQGVDLAGLGYVGDLGDLSNSVGNIITKESLNVFNTNPREGIKQILKVSGREGTKLTSYDLGWLIAPRLNASGRMYDPINSLNLLISNSKDLKMAEEMEEVNKERQGLTKDMYDEAFLGLSNNKFVGMNIKEKVVITHSKNFHEGVIGLIAAKLVRSLYKPSICISWCDDGLIGKGSCRSVEGINMHSLLNSVSDLLENFGGHEMAAGFTIKKSNYDKFQQKLLKISSLEIKDEYLRPRIYYDSEITPDLLSTDLLDFIEGMEPYGNGNPKPLFMLSNVSLVYPKQIGKDSSHLSFSLADKNIKSIFFGGGGMFSSILSDTNYDLLFSFEKNIWKGVTYPQLVINDMRESA